MSGLLADGHRPGAAVDDGRLSGTLTEQSKAVSHDDRSSRVSDLMSKLLREVKPLVGLALGLVRFIASLLLCAVAFLVGIYFVISLCVAVFILTGTLSIGQPMYFELATPSWRHLLLFQCACVVIIPTTFLLARMLWPFAKRSRLPAATSHL
jgi:hypothetical protein